MRQTTAVVLALVSLFCGGCGGGSSSSPASPSEPAGPPAFTVAPIEPSALQYIVPVGNIGPWAQTFPIDHAYLYHHLGSGTFTPIPVLDPAAGTVENTYPGRNGEVKAWIRINSQFTYYFDHIVLASGLATGSRVDAGAVLGTSGGAALDFAVRDIGFNGDAQLLELGKRQQIRDCRFRHETGFAFAACKDEAGSLGRRGVRSPATDCDANQHDRTGAHAARLCEVHRVWRLPFINEAAQAAVAATWTAGRG